MQKTMNSAQMHTRPWVFEHLLGWFYHQLCRGFVLSSYRCLVDPRNGAAPHDDAMLKYKFSTLGNSCAVIWTSPLGSAILQTSDPAKLVDYPTGS